MKHSKALFLALSLAAAIIFAAGIAPARAAEEEPRTIRVNGEATIEVEPDQAEIILGIITEGKDAGDVQEENSKKSASLMEALKEYGIDEKDIQTKSYNLAPVYSNSSHQERPEPERTSSTPKDGSQQINGYRATNQMEVKVHNLEKVGEIIELAVNNGANNVTNISFTAGEAMEAKKQALKKAVNDARARAEVLAESLNVELAGIQTANGSWYVNNPRPMQYEKMQAGGAGDSTAPAPVSPGMVEIRAHANIEYLIN